MRFRLFCILVISFCSFSFGQDKTHSQAIDSIKKSVLISKNKDSLSIAKAHYSIGELYRFSFFGDSAYYHYVKSEKIFKKMNNTYELALTLYGIAVVQKNEKDFTGSEVTSVEALSLLDQLKQTKEVKRYKSYIYNNLGLLFGELGQFEKSISYHKDAIQIKNEYDLKGTYNINVSKNNLALSYKKAGEYQLALNYYSEILSNKNLINERPDFYALVLDNYAHTLYLSKEFNDLPDLYFKALRITDSINPQGGYNSIIINQHLAKYYYDKNIIESAKYYAYKAKRVAELYHKDELLTSLLLLSEIEDGVNATNHLKAYVKLNDSLQKSERLSRNKFALIRFETRKVEQENVRIARERMWLFIISVTLIITSFLVYLVITQRNKNKELKFIQQQQETNEEIYNLMLSQQDNIEEARTLEKKRISEELHDGVLGRLFGTRLSLDSLNMGTNAEAINTRSQYISELKTIEDDIRKVSHELNTDFVSGSGFVDIIKTLVETQTKAYGFDYELKTNDDINWEEASNKTKIHIYRIIQESLQNIYKHANATLVKISFQVKNNVFCLKINDNGSGFDVNKAKRGIGLKNINSRVDEIKGDLTINSELNKGTTITIKVRTD